MTVTPKKGRAVLWWNKKKETQECGPEGGCTAGGPDWRSRHVGCPLIKGEKWAATRWIHHKAMGRGL